jgi:17beta-estradiol 17-dehydrogenase / very-long-chain 3-oxoacyl-CoA reductase
VLISRTLSKLQDQAKYLEEKYSINTKVIAVDFTEPDSIYPLIKSQINEIDDIALMFNNVGMCYDPEFFDVFAQDEKYMTDLLNCNIMSVTKMTAIVLPKMLKKQKGIIVNNASISAYFPMPLLSVYSATKAYVDFFSK